MRWPAFATLLCIPGECFSARWGREGQLVKKKKIKAPDGAGAGGSVQHHGQLRRLRSLLSWASHPSHGGSRWWKAVVDGGVCWRLHYPRNSYTLPLAGATYYKGEMTPGKAFILLDSLGRLQNISPPQRDKSPVPYPQYVSSILQEMLCNNRWYRSILPLAPLCCDISLLKGVVVTRSVPL